ncbi:type II toxin-antitoxin system RelB/DinJ family antitoxin [Levilactobacillus yonginensis]|uniref:type II toxin-antitoxin system RelB/DinJ family antitoxin n=1 Tax=Levilactobacillus yonginensis TaxID=1054041 RepID=UPI001CDBE006|nr:type II toxin-antitoxin system RelB/DinJ family antitoxin [Levilactobacillus yonginensis]
MINTSKSEKTRLTIRMDLDRKQKAEQVASSLGIDLTGAVNLFISQMIKENGLPFKPTNDTLASDLKQALKEVKNGETTTVSVDEFMKILDDPDGYTND